MSDLNGARTYAGVVYPAQCDAMGHMNVQYYIQAFDQAMWHLVHRLGYRQEWQHLRGEGWADVKHEVTFSRELAPGSLFMIESGVAAVGTKSLMTLHVLRTMDNQEAARDTITSVYFDLRTRSSLPLPADLRAAAERHLQE